jgi:hypothetical protein
MISRSAFNAGLVISAFLVAACGGNVQSGQAGGAAGATATGGSSGSGGGGAVGGSGGTAGALPDLCTLPKEVGPCEAAFAAYWHNPKTGVCEPFTYGGCQGNANRFDSLAACQSACSGGTPDMDACSLPGDCVLAGIGCCGPCELVDTRSAVAINRAFADTYGQTLGCGGIACGACPDVTEFERTSQYFIATCEAGHCTVTDLRQSDLTRCGTDADCVLRDGADCCQGCDGTGIVVLNKGAKLEGLVCPSTGYACDACAPTFPPGYVPLCASGRCGLAAQRH